MHKPSQKHVKLPAIFAVVTHLFLPGQVAAEESPSSFSAEDETILSNFTNDVGATDRIRAADRLRTLTQEIASATCYFTNGMLVEESRVDLSHSVDEFEKLLVALLQGDPELHIIGEEQKPRTIREIQTIMDLWIPKREAAQGILDDPSNSMAAMLIYDYAPQMLALTDHLLSQLEVEYSHPTEVLVADVLLMQFAGRQAMMTQKIAFETCLVWSGVGGQKQVDDLKKISNQFDLIAHALHDGLPSVGIVPAPTEEIRIELEHVIHDWGDVLAHLEHITSGGEIPSEDVEWIYIAMAKKMERMEEIVKMYADYSRRALI